MEEQSSGVSTSSSASIRVLTRRRSPPPRPPATTFSSSSSNPHTPHPSDPTSSSIDGGGGGGVVVVGFVGSGPTTDATHLIDRILDAKVFTFAGLHEDLPLPDHRDCFRRHRITYHYESQKGVLFLRLSSSRPPSDCLEECESDHLKGMLFMFSVCHVIVFLHEGLRFDTQILKILRVLQAAKRSISPFVRSQITAMSSGVAAAVPKASASSQPYVPRRTNNRQSSSISLMSGSSSHPSALPGQCVPIVLFVLCDDVSDGLHSNSSNATDDLTESPSNSKGEGSGFKKKLQTSLDAQIRFLIKKCRILAGTESGSSRGIGHAGSLPLFSLDASRVVALIDRRAVSQGGEALDFVTALMEENSFFDSVKATDIFMFDDNQVQDLCSEDMDIQTIKDFIYRQTDILRGRGGGLSSNATNSGSISGVGMVAAAAAAAAASASAGKLVSAPELPRLENWLASSIQLINALLRSTKVENAFVDDKTTRKTNDESQNENITPQRRRNAPSAKADISCLESSMGLNMKFSVSWCERALPAAKEVYLKDLPACYPTTLHHAQMEKALLAFHLMVRGPAVKMFAKKLEVECTSFWESGRQLCDAISLTGKPCMHQRHSTVTTVCSGSPTITSIEKRQKEHSSGYFFLHACACGRSRLLREDPFDFDMANVKFNCFASSSCEDALPSLVLPKGNTVTSLIPPTSWRLLRIGGARYYKPSKGLLQIGFCSKEIFLHKWTISLGNKKDDNALSTSVTDVSSKPDCKDPVILDEEMKKPDIIKHPKEILPRGSENQIKAPEIVSSDDTNISFGKGLPSFTMKKPFAEVVAGTTLVDSTVPILKQSKQAKVTPAKGGRKMGTVDQPDDQVHETGAHQESLKVESIKVQVNLQKPGTNYKTVGNPFLQIGSNLVPVNMSDNGKLMSNSYGKQAVVYVGFEHECSYGHRFLLSSEHLMKLDPFYSAEIPERLHGQTGNVSHEKVLPSSFRTTTAVNNMQRGNKPPKSAAYSSQKVDRFTLFPRAGTGKSHSVTGLSVPSNTVENPEANLSHVRIDDGSSAFSLLNRNLPIYMNCPHCKSSSKKNHQDIKFASKVSQLRRIFLVTPPFPTVLATCPVIQFEGKCLPQSTPNFEEQLCFTFGSQVILPPESFLTMSLPFVYGIQKDDGSQQPLRHLENQPELTAWLVKCTALQILSLGHEIDEKLVMR